MSARETSNAYRVLIVDDNRAIHQDLRKILAPRNSAPEDLLGDEEILFGRVEEIDGPRFEIDSTYQGQEGLHAVDQAVAAGRPYAMAFVGIRMPPGWDGIETVSRLWKVDPDLQVVICTAYADYSWNEIVRRLGHSDGLVILKKPFDNIEVIQLAHGLTRKWNNQRETQAQRRDLELILQQSFHHAPVMMAITALEDGSVLEVNRKFEQTLGVPRAELVGSRLTECGLLTEEDLRRMMQRGRDGQGETLEIRLTARDGRTVFGEHAGQLIPVGGRPCVLSAIADITERKQHEAERELMLQLLRLVNKPSPLRELCDGVRGLLKDWSDCDIAAVRLFSDGSLAADSITRTWMAQAVIQGTADPMQPYFTENGSFWSGHVNHLPGWSPEWPPCQSLALVPLTSGGKTFGVLHLADSRSSRLTAGAIRILEQAAASLALGIEQRSTLEALRSSQEQYRLVADHTSAWEFWIAPDGAPLYHSPSCQWITGYDAAAFLSDPGLLEKLLDAEDRDAYRSHLDEAGRHKPGTVEFRIRTRGGDRTVIEHVCQAIHGEDGKYLGTRGSNRDITERRRAEQERERLQMELAQSRKMESIGRLAGGIAHDFNNLLTVINGYSQLVVSGLEENNPLRGDVAEILKAGEHAASLTKQLLAFSRKQVLQPRRLDLNRVVEEMLPMLERLVGETIEVRVDLKAGRSTVHADPHQLEQVLMNLAVNARDAMPHGGKLVISTADQGASPDGRGEGNFVLLVVSDTGVGIDEETRERIFEPFFTTKGAGHGTGLGLSMVQGIVAQSGGYIAVDSKRGQGTAFRIYLPALAEAATGTGKPATVPPVGGRELILVVEDNPQVRGYTVGVLEELGYRVLQAEDGAKALRLCEAEESRIDLLLTDVVMPNLSGGELAASLEKSRPGIKILFMSGYTDNIIAHHGTLEEGSEFLQKPFSPSELAAKVRAVMGAQKQADANLAGKP